MLGISDSEKGNRAVLTSRLVLELKVFCDRRALPALPRQDSKNAASGSPERCFTGEPEMGNCESSASITPPTALGTRPREAEEEEEEEECMRRGGGKEATR
jgi:hypothetical protein